MLLFPVGLAFARLAVERQQWALVNLISLLLLLGSLFFPQRGGNFYSYYVNPNNAAVLLTIFIVFLFPAMKTWRPRFSHGISFAGLTLAIYLLWLTNGRGAWLGVILGTVGILLIRSGFRKRYRILVCSVLIVCFSIVLVMFNSKGYQLSGREVLWRGLSQDTMENNLFFGFGFNGTKELIDQLGLITRTAHNIFLEIFVTTGLVGLIFMLVFFFFLWKIFSRYSYPNNHIVLASLLAISAFVVMGQFDLKFSSFRFSATLSFFLGMIYSQRREKPAPEEGELCV
jgi:O-antigen ligase